MLNEREARLTAIAMVTAFRTGNMPDAVEHLRVTTGTTEDGRTDGDFSKDLGRLVLSLVNILAALADEPEIGPIVVARLEQLALAALTETDGDDQL